MPVIQRRSGPKPNLPTADYVVVGNVKNVHIAGRKVEKGDVIALNAPQAKFWLMHGTIVAKPAASAAAPAPAPETQA
ncbi:hypothetical protein [Rhodoblastus sp.]|uniref:hypothetical protein n=1 Tax=Rhodoblastus sp. TaxID=1962975 RepID=UPI003F9D3BA4